MNKTRIKIIIMIALAGIAAVIWGKNLGLFGNSANQYKIVNAEKPTERSEADSIMDIEYKEPKFNPFNAVRRETATDKKKTANNSPKAAPAPVSGLFSINGIVLDGNNPSAVFVDKSGQSRVLKVSDTIGVWQIRAIQTDKVIFSSGIFRDTLWLNTNLGQ